MIITSVLLWRKQVWEFLLAVPLLEFSLTMGRVIIAIFIISALTGMPVSLPAGILIGLIMLLSAYFSYLFLKEVNEVYDWPIYRSVVSGEPGKNHPYFKIIASGLPGSQSEKRIENHSFNLYSFTGFHIMNILGNLAGMISTAFKVPGDHDIVCAAGDIFRVFHHVCNSFPEN